MKSKKISKKKENDYRNDTEIKIKERKKQSNKKFNKRSIYSLIEEEEDVEIDLYGYLEE